MFEEFKGISGIYCFENLINGHKYIGQSDNLERRYRHHQNDLKRNKDGCNILQGAYNKYGNENLNFWIIELCEISILNEREKFWIKELHSHCSEGGYNISWGGDEGMRGRKHSDEVLEKMRKPHPNLNQWGKNNHRFGISMSDSDKKRRSDKLKGEKSYWYGRKHTVESIKKMSESKIGMYVGDKNPMYGKHHTDEAKRKIRENGPITTGSMNPNYGNKFPEEIKERYSKERTGVKTRKNPTSEYHGVSFDGKKYNSSFTHKGEGIYLGRFQYEIEAALAYNEVAIEFYGINARINQISQEEIDNLWNLE
jgi:group I intron endonuclease